MIIKAIILSIIIIPVSFVFYMLIRNQLVYRYRETIKDDSIRFSVSYHEMVKEFWVWPLSRFFKEEK